MGVPLLPFHWGYSLLFLVPVVGIEARHYMRRLDLDRRTAYRASWGANLLTTLLGVPLLWLASALTLEAVRFDNPFPGSAFFEGVVHFAWLDPHEDALFDSDGLLAPALLAFLAPAFLLSIVFEAWIIRRASNRREGATLAVWGAHVRSYALLASVALSASLLTGSSTSGLDTNMLEELRAEVAQALEISGGDEVMVHDHGWIVSPAYELYVEGVPPERADEIEALVLEWLRARGGGPLVLTLREPGVVDEHGILRHRWIGRARLDPRD